jgi:hypothetical protein
MPIDLILPLSMTLAVTSWILIFVWYVHPVLRARSFADALQPLVLLHCFRYVGLMFLIPGVTAEPLDARFAALAALRISRPVALTTVWIFNVWGLADLFNAVARGVAYTPDGALGAAFWIPAVFVPPLLVSHGYIFWRLLREVRSAGVAGGEPRPIGL